ncbi:hypothetical protein SELMODRAFT_417794 [Selaginella moellendorffii]|uniref:Uncharacterized protein n=1 Tax=Selaginella moellendorffii TaxID=88036 RepID=D8S3M8_SELML|nr:hypothetical protein SELMODRAFT_417794 [Selaginella moellendorffii]
MGLGIAKSLADRWWQSRIFPTTLSEPSLLLLFVAWGWIRLCKLLVYESDGHFKLYRDIKKEPGMFATLILQLPAWLPGRCSHGSAWQRHFDAGFKDTAFFADCEHEIQPDANSSPEKLVFCLEHKYTETNLCFSGLKGQDRLVVELLGNVPVLQCCSGVLAETQERRARLPGQDLKELWTWWSGGSFGLLGLAHISS